MGRDGFRDFPSSRHTERQLTAPLTTVTLSHDAYTRHQARVSVLYMYELVVSVSVDAGKLVISLRSPIAALQQQKSLRPSM